MTERTDRLGLPLNLSEWFAKENLTQWIAEDVAMLDWSNPALVKLVSAHPEFRPKVMLHLLTFAYATGIYGAEDIASDCYSDPTLRDLCEGAAPTAQELIAFRRENRGLLRWFLLELFKRAVKARCGDLPMSPGLKRALSDLATERLDRARHLDRGTVWD